MKKIEKYVADDGKEFNLEADCIEYESICTEISNVIFLLPKIPENYGCSFANGRGYIQHEEEAFYKARSNLLMIANRLMPHKWFDQSLSDKSTQPSYAGRIISEINTPLNNAWYRVMCTDKSLREWGQPYFALNQDKIDAKDVFELQC